MGLSSLFLVLIPLLTSFAVCQLEEFVSIDCGGTSNYTDSNTGLAWISDSGIMQHGISVEVETPNGSTVQHQRRRDFPIDSKKYCYTLSTEERRRYLVRATFQYGSLDSGDTYPQFQLYLDATKWATVSIYDASRIYVKEMIIRAPSNSS
ncbi:LRR receptor serine/threonine-protein kinase [Spatholobus suberectus]|nr:LRR receptor serine/threonine-protein kinase [Spatholobus suberectus]